MLNIGTTVDSSELPFGLHVRALTDVEVDQVIDLLGRRIGAIFDRHSAVEPGTLAIIFPGPAQLDAASALFGAVLGVMPAVIARGCDEPDQEDAASRLSFAAGLVLFARIVELTMEKLGRDAILAKLASAAGEHSNLPAFLGPILRDRVKALDAALVPHIESLNRKARRRASASRRKGS